eukprot:759424-Hanusia_phi.AAC.7
MGEWGEGDEELDRWMERGKEHVVEAFRDGITTDHEEEPFVIEPDLPDTSCIEQDIPQTETATIYGIRRTVLLMKAEKLRIPSLFLSLFLHQHSALHERVSFSHNSFRFLNRGYFSNQKLQNLPSAEQISFIVPLPLNQLLPLSHHRRDKPQVVLMGKSNANTQSQASDSRPLIVFPGGGIYFWWQAGVVQGLQKRISVDSFDFTGASAGSLSAVFAACGVDMMQAFHLARKLRYLSPQCG